MNRSLESALRFVNLTTSGLLAGSLGFGEAALVPGWQDELPRHRSKVIDVLRHLKYYNAIGPLALGTAVTLAVGTRNGAVRRVLDAASAVALAGVLAATIMVTVPINKELEEQPPADYPDDRSQSLAKNWARAHAVRTTLGISAFVCAVASGITPRR
jgi:4-hydroxy-L-threonine phosphate dehydrogenase PdxA